MKTPIWISIPGINCFPGESDNWSGRFVTHLMSIKPYKAAEKVEYHCNAITRAFHNKARAYRLYKTLSYYKDRKIILVNHSNGADVTIDMLNFYDDWPNIYKIHFVCPACESDFEKNNLNKFIKEGRIGSCNIYMAGKDFMLKLAHTYIARFLLGYGVLGLEGPKNIDNAIKNKVNVIWKNWIDYGHSTCWEDKNFDKTMKLFI